MHGILTALAALFTAKEIIKEKTEPVAPPNTRFDWDAYWADVENGMPAMEQVRKRQRGGYMTTKTLPEPKEVIPKVVDMKRYQHDKALYGEAIAEVNRKNGMYMYIRKT